MRAYVFVLLSLSLENQDHIAITFDTNLALNRVATYCNDPTPLKWITDGDRNLSKIITKTCVEYSYVEVDLGEKHLVYYVVVYEGINLDSVSQTSIFLRFVVDGVRGDNISRCGMFNRRVQPTIGMRVNCKVGEFQRIRISSQVNEGFLLAEIEVYTIGLKFSRNIRGILHSCIEDVPITPVHKKDCLEFCWSKQLFIAAKQDNLCVCMSEYTLRMKTKKINLRAKKCGETNFMTYFIRPQLPYYIGCFSRSGLNYAKTYRGVMDPSQCIESCSNFSFSGILNGTECSCMEKINHDLVDDFKLCNVICMKNLLTFCGGSGHASVFGNTDKITNFFHCSGKWDEYGVCGGPCEKHYAGDYCLELISDFMPVPIYSTKSSSSSSSTLSLTPSSSSSSSSTTLFSSSTPSSSTSSTPLTTSSSSSSSSSSSLSKQSIALFSSSTQSLSLSSTTSSSKLSLSSTPPSTTLLSTLSSSSLPPSTTSFSSSILSLSSSSSSTSSSKFTESKCPVNHCQGRPHMECKIIKTSFECVCVEGFSNKNGSCVDSDECANAPCNIQTSTCVNTGGSYTCQCKPGYNETDNDICISNGSAMSFEISDSWSYTKIAYLMIPLLGLLFMAFFAWFVKPPKSDED